MKIAIMTDVNAGLDYVGYETGVYCLRSSINFPNQAPLVDGIDIRADEFYERIKNITKSSEIPSTSAPSVADIYATLDELIDKGYTDVIHFPISFELSSTGQTVQMLADEYKDKINVHVINTKTAAFMQGYIALEAKRMADEGKTVEEIIEYSSYLIDNNQVYFLVDDLNYLVKNGRLSNAAGFLGSLFKIKPILSITKEGKIESIEKVRTYQKALKRVEELITEYIGDHEKITLFGFHSNRIDTLTELLNGVTEKRPDLAGAPIHYITPAVGAHIGCGVIAIAAFKLK